MIALSMLLVPTFAIADPPPHVSPEESHCEKCHTVDNWNQITFPHDATGFPLKGAHANISCSACHAAGFAQKVTGDCASCHRDAHAGEFGMRCGSCHDEVKWRGAINADAHRRTNFPLDGRHALIPCEECHIDVREKRFSRAALACNACHAKDAARAALHSIDHVKANFGTDCQRCHSPQRFDSARFPDHEMCFPILRGAHRGFACLSCHTTMMNVTVTGACMTRNAACSSCHRHSCDRENAAHANIPGYQCKDRKCFECHQTGIR
jgi:hypothetical protein